MTAEVIQLEQGSEAWFAARCGKATASRISDVIARTKTGYGTSRKNYAAELVAERLTGQTADSYQSPAMKWGIDNEPYARAAYEFFRDAEVQEVGFVDHPEIEMSGASPDGLVGDDGLVEIKCPNTSTHIETLLNGKLADKYIVQVQWQIACTGRQWADFVSFDPRMPEDLRLFVKRIFRDDERIKELEAEVKQFLGEVDYTVHALKEWHQPHEQTPLDAG